MAWIAPSPVPQIRSRIPLIVAISGSAYAVSYGRPPGVATHTMSPVRLSSAMNQCARLACVPQLEIAVDERRHRPPSVRGEGCELLADRSLPEELAVLV